MKKIYTSIIFFLITITANRLYAQSNSVKLTLGAGAGVLYPSITSAYAAIPGSVTGNYVIELQPSYLGTDASEVYPIQLTDRGLLVGGFTITIRPAAGFNTAVIKRPTAAAGPVLQINGGDNIIIDGRPGGVTSTSSNYLSINDAFVGSNTNRNIELLNSANYNTIQYINATAADATAAGAGNRVIFIGGTTTTANKYNTIQYCSITGGLRGIQDFGLSDAVPNTNTVIQNNTVTNFGAIGIFAGSSQSNITIQNNLVQLTSYNVLVTNTISPFALAVTGIQQQSLVSGTSLINGNTISMINTSTTVSSLTAISESGIGVETITGNNIIALSTPASATAANTFIVGINGGNGATTAPNTINISKNSISGLSSTSAINFRGVSLFFATSGSTVNLNNNFVAITDPNAAASAIFGILLGNSNPAGITYTTNCYYNSVNIGGAQSSTNANGNYGIYKSDASVGSTHNIKNNVVINSRTGGTSTAQFLGFYIGSTSGTLSVDYNTYWGADATVGYAAGGWDPSVYRNGGLAAYKTSAGTNEQHSNFANVSFVSPTNLHLVAPSITDINLYGTPIAGVTTDFDNNTRSAINPFQGADEPGGPVPIKLLSFTGENKGQYNQLSWITASEQNNKGFELERSADGRNYNSIASVASKAVDGNSTLPLSYTFNDDKLLVATSFYRLKQIDKNGTITYSSIVTIKGKTISQLMIANIYPNPVTEHFNLIIGVATDSKTSLVISDVSGKVLLQQAYTLKTGDHIIPVNASLFATGLYFITVKNAATGEMVTKSFVK